MLLQGRQLSDANGGSTTPAWSTWRFFYESERTLSSFSAILLIVARVCVLGRLFAKPFL